MPPPSDEKWINVHFPAWLRYPDGAIESCVITSVSSTGAKLKLPTEKSIPDRFDILLTGNGSVIRSCELTLQHARKAEVRIFDSFDGGIRRNEKGGSTTLAPHLPKWNPRFAVPGS